MRRTGGNTRDVLGKSEFPRSPKSSQPRDSATTLQLPFVPLSPETKLSLSVMTCLSPGIYWFKDQMGVGYRCAQAHFQVLCSWGNRGIFMDSSALAKRVGTCEQPGGVAGLD